MNMGFVCLMGMGTVFIGLVCIIALCSITSAVVRSGEKKQEPVQNAVPQNKGGEIPDRGQLIAAICAAAAEDMGTDISALRVVSFKKL